MFFLRLISVFTLVFGLAAFAIADEGTHNVEVACHSLERPNIDCACVAGRINVMQQSTTHAEIRPVIRETYLYLLGNRDDISSMETAMELNPVSLIDADEELAAFGGNPDDLPEFEGACVIAGAAPIDIPAPDAGSAIAEYSRNCQSGGVGTRYCNCLSARKRPRMTAQEFRAYVRNYSDYLGKSSIVPKSEYDEDVFQSGRKKADQFTDIDYNYCEALTFADDMVGASESQRADLPEPIKHATDLEKGITGSATDIVAANCKTNDNAPSFCTCLAQAFDSKVTQEMSPKASTAIAAMMYGDHLNTSDLMTMMSADDPGIAQQAAMAMMSISDIEDGCR